MTKARRRALYYYLQCLKWERILKIYPANCSNWPFRDITRKEAEAMQKIRAAHLPYFIKQIKNNRQ